MDDDIYVVMILLNILIFVAGVLKVMFYLRVSDDFGRLVKLLADSIYDMTVFFIFMILMIEISSVLFTVVGAEFDTEEYPNLPFQLAYFIQVFRNSIGDIAPPGYEKWL